MTDPFNYKNKRVIVTGCFSGIGHATSKLLLEAGAQVHGIDVRKSDLPFASFSNVDLREQASIDLAIDAIGGSIDALFGCAGLAPMHAPLDVMTVNFVGTRHLAERVIAMMPPGGAIVSIGSNGGAGWRKHLSALRELADTVDFDEAVRWCKEHPDSLSNAYGYSKEAVAVWTLQRSATSIAKGIRLNFTSPGAVQTPMLVEIEKVAAPAAIDAVAQPIGRRSSAQEQAWPLLMLNSDLCSYVNGVDLPVDGGFIATCMLQKSSNIDSR